MSERLGHDWRIIHVDGKTIRYKLHSSPRARDGCPVYKGKYVIEGSKKIIEISLGTRDGREANRIHREVVEAHILKKKQKATGLKQVLRDYETYKRAEKVSEKHLTLVISRIEKICTGLGISMIHEIDETQVKLWIDKQQRRKKTKPISDRTAHHYACSIKAFTRWLYRTPKLLASDPLRGLRIKLRGDLKATFVRRAFTDAEFTRLCKNALASEDVFRGLDGTARHWLYRIGDATGYRASELASIVPAACQFDGDSPFIEVVCTVSKRRTHERQFISSDLAVGFREFLRDRRREDLIWPNEWYKNATKMMRLDLGGITQDTEKSRLGFHSLRHTHVTRMVQAAGRLGISSREVMKQCRLSSESLLTTYGHCSDENHKRLIAEARRQDEFEQDTDGMESL